MPNVDYRSQFIFRMIHFENLEFVLNNGMHAKNSPVQDPDYINIGDVQLIEQRRNYHVGINPPGGDLGDFVPFYFGGHSPMLYNIKTGYRGVQFRPQEQIVYLVCRIGDVMEQCAEWCFTDGHAKNHITEFFNRAEDLSQVDWAVVKSRQWSNDDNDRDRMRRKQAEFLVKNQVPACCIAGIIVRTEQRRQFVQEILDRLSMKIAIKVDTDNKYYYP